MSITDERDIPETALVAPEGTEADNPPLIARQAIVDANRAVLGYER